MRLSFGGFHAAASSIALRSSDTPFFEVRAAVRGDLSGFNEDQCAKEHLGRVHVGLARLKPPLGLILGLLLGCLYLLQPLHVHGQLGSDTPQHRRAARIFEWGGFVPIWSDLLRGSARRRSFYLSSWGCSSVSPAFGVLLPTSRVWMEKMTHRRPERTRGARGTRAHPQSRVRDVGWLPVRLPDRLPVEVLCVFCVSRRVRERRLSRTEKSKNSNSFLVSWVWADIPNRLEPAARGVGNTMTLLCFDTHEIE